MTAYDSAQSPPSGQEHRGHARAEVLVGARLLCEGVWRPCEVVNISVGGAKLRVQESYSPGQELRLDIELCGQFDGVAAWVRGGELGLRCTGDTSAMAEALIALATYG